MSEKSPRRSFFGAIGPAIIVAAVVLGPGSILTSSKVGCQYGYSMLWVLAAAGLMMVAMTALASRLGMTLDRSLCSELAHRLGRPFAAVVGVTMFLIVACFQSSNNIAVLASIESLVGESTGGGRGLQTGLLIALNGAIIVALLGFKRLYQPLEKIMVGAVFLMLIAFLANLCFSQPSLSQILGGLLPKLPSSGDVPLLPYLSEGKVVDPWWAMQGLVATTFSVAAAFYQSYLVREKGWGTEQAREGLMDSVFGIAALVGASAMIMITSASVLHGVIAPEELRTAADVAGQLEPLFGGAATLLFLIGILAAALSSFLVNAMVGGTLLADGFGLGSAMDDRWPRWFTLAALVIGMGVAIASTAGGMSRVNLIIFAQALTVLGGPILAFSLLFLATRQTDKEITIPLWMKGAAAVGGLATLALALRTAWRLYLQLG